MRPLKVSTEVTVRIGPFVDKTDGVTEETGLAGNGTEISKNGGAFGTGPTLGTHDAEGWYPVTLTTTHTNTVGDLVIKSHDSATHLPVWEVFTVLPALVYDSLVGGTDNLQVDTIQVGGTSQTARDLGASVLLSSGTGTGQISLSSGTVTVGTNNDKTGYALANDAITAAVIATGAIDADAIAPDAGTEIATAVWASADRQLTALDEDVTAIDINGQAVGSVVGAVGSVTGNVGGNVAGSVASVTGAVGSVTGNVGGNVVGTIGGLTAAALKDFFDTDSTTTYASAVAGSVVKEIADNAGGSSLTAADIADAVWDEASTGHTDAGKAGAQLWTDVDAILADTGTDGVVVAAGSKTGYSLTATTGLGNQTANLTGNLSGSVGSVASGGITSSSFAAGAITAAAIADNAIDAASLASDVAPEIWGQTLTEATSVPAANASALSALGWLFLLARNKLEQTASTQTAYADDGSTPVATAGVTDDGTTFTRAEWS